MLNIQNQDLARLYPTVMQMNNSKNLYLFPSNNIDILKIEIAYEAGSGYQPQPLCASNTAQLLKSGTQHHTAAEIAEFMDYHGIGMGVDYNAYNSSLTFYTLSKYAHKAIDMLYDMLTAAVFPEHEFQLRMQKCYQTICANHQKPSFLATKHWDRLVYGADHPQGRYAEPEDAKLLTLASIKSFYQERYAVGAAEITLSGKFNDAVVEQVNSLWGSATAIEPYKNPFEIKTPPTATKQRIVLRDAAQSAIEIGRMVPIAWHSNRCGTMALLNYILGGYFGSRLMSNLREDKGYTYGINSRYQLQRHNALFFIKTNVSSEVEQQAVTEIYTEIDRLCQTLVPEEELNRVKGVMMGDFLRSIDGVFECSDRFNRMQTIGANINSLSPYLDCVKTTTPAELRDLAQAIFDPKSLTEVVVGA